MTITLPGKPPSKKNSKRIICTGSRPRVLSSEAYEAWHEEMMLRVRGFRPKKPLLSASVVMTFFAKDRRSWDLTNAAESVMDLLVDAEILADDNIFVVADNHQKFGGIDSKNPRVEIEINELSHA